MVLVADDDRFYAQRIREILSDYGVQSMHVSNAANFLKFDLLQVQGVVVDVMLPNDPDATGISYEEARGGFSTGVALVRRVLEKSKELPIVLLSGAPPGGEAERWAAEQKIPFIAKSGGQQDLIRALQQLGVIGDRPPPKAFIVHGHDDQSVLQLKDFLQNSLKWQEPIVLREQQSGGKTIIEKFEDYANEVDYVFVLLTPDDTVDLNSVDDAKRRRSRQNVIFELGFFYGMLGRKSSRVIALRKGNIELPSDIHGIIWIDVTSGISAAAEEIRRELEGSLASRKIR
jgi:predicted nucleotide-binding protein